MTTARRAIAVLASTVLLVTAGVIAAPVAAAEAPIVFADAALHRAVNQALDFADNGQWDGSVAADAPVSPSDARKLTEINAQYDGITSLAGIEHLSSLRRLIVVGNSISDLTPVASLTDLQTFYGDNNKIADLRPLNKLPNLEEATVGNQWPALGTAATGEAVATPLFDVTGAPAAVYWTTPGVQLRSDNKSWRIPKAGTYELSYNAIGTTTSGVQVNGYGVATQKVTGATQFTTEGTPQVSGDIFVGGTVTADPGTWDKGTSFTYQWLRDGNPIAGATSKTYRVPSSLLGRTLSVRVTASKDGVQTLTKTSAASAALMKGTKPTLTGTAAFGQTMKVTAGTWTKGAKLTYRWYADNLPIPGATKTSYKVTSSEQGKHVHVVVTAKLAGYHTVASSTSKTKNITLLTTSSRASVKAAYKKILAPAVRVQPGWTGSVKGCKLGTETAKSKSATLDAINFVRALNQLDGVYLDTSLNKKALQSSLIQHANNTLTHMPSKKLKCWTQGGYDGASTGNLSWGAVSAGAVVGYMLDDGAWNTSVGHRRWLLTPQTRIMGTGSTSVANTIVVVNGTAGKYASKYNVEPEWMEWPSKGWFPAQLEPWGRWSLSESNRDVDFSKAKVTVTTGGKKLKVKTYPARPGAGPNTLVWEVTGVKPPTGKKTKTYTVKVTGIKGAKSTSYTYKVQMFDANAK